MNPRTRFQSAMAFQPVDRLPVWEWASWWDQTLERWRGEGLPEDLTDPFDIRGYFGQDPHRQFGLSPRKSTCPEAPFHGAGIVEDLDGYLAVKEHLYPEPRESFDAEALVESAERQAKGELVVWLTLEGFFWYPRTLLGIERHLSAFYEQPETLHAMNRDVLEFHLAALDAFCEVCTPDFVTFAEDMSYRGGPMISPTLFDTFLAPYYRELVPSVVKRGILPFVDTDGNAHDLVPWFLDVGIDGFLPLERQAGCDVAALREKYPHVRLIGGFDKLCMTDGEAAMRSEFDRLLPVLRQGAFIPGVDHQTPPAVSFDTYRVYLDLLNEYCAKAAS